MSEGRGGAWGLHMHMHVCMYAQARRGCVGLHRACRLSHTYTHAHYMHTCIRLADSIPPTALDGRRVSRQRLFYELLSRERSLGEG